MLCHVVQDECALELDEDVHHWWQAWGEVRGGELPEGCMEDMLTYAAEVTGAQSLTASAFKQLVAALDC